MRIFAILLALYLALPATAQERRPELTPEQKAITAWAFVNMITAFVVGVPVFIGATVAGKQKELCDVMKGTYDPTAKDICAGGDWVRVIPYLPKPERN